MAPMKVAGRGAAVLSTTAVASLLVLGGLAAWLGVEQAPNGLPPVPTHWDDIVAATRSAGSLAFTIVARSYETLAGQTGTETSVERTTGGIDFAAGNARAVTVISSPGARPQWIQSVVVGSRAYTRFGRDADGAPRFTGPWLRTVPWTLPPFGGTANAGLQLPSGQPELQELGHARLLGTPMTLYQLSSVRVSCPVLSAGGPAVETDRSVVWVDGDGRLRRLESLSREHLTGSAQGTIEVATITTFGRFGTPVLVGAPPEVAPGPFGAKAGQSPLAGCLVTPG
jgi:hypothetical protein